MGKELVRLPVGYWKLLPFGAVLSIFPHLPVSREARRDSINLLKWPPFHFLCRREVINGYNFPENVSP